MSASKVSAHVGVFGSRSAQWAADLRARTRVPVSVIAENTHPEHPFTTVLIFVEANAEVSWQDWLTEMEQTAESIDRIFPRLANPAKLLLIGHSPDQRAHIRHRSQGFLTDLTNGFGAYATTEFGLDASVNAIEVPPTAESQLLVVRLAEFVEHGHVAADGHVIAVEDIEEQSLAVAISMIEI